MAQPLQCRRPEGGDHRGHRLHETGEHFHEEFCEYTYDLDTIRTALEKHGFALESVCDGETFGPLTEDSQRYFFCAVKQYTQLEG